MLKLILFIAALPLVPLALAHGPAPQGTVAGVGTDPVRCEVRATAIPGGVRLKGSVASDKALAGSYALRVEKRGSGGSSSNMQSGEFEVAAGAEEIVSEVGLGLERGASYRAELTVRWPGGEAACVSTYPDRV
ncbi:MAG TPA: curli-like amyloid fiber formation chaperone CsgH [Afifellaceae bacterium]|nr:curli-like amyloid fiber formation chaperone CsgH [Afifellaceae bacterium]